MMDDGNLLAHYGSLLARICLSAVFLWSGITKLYDPAGGTAEVAALRLPAPRLCLTLTILCQIGGGLLVLLGFWTRAAALVLLGFTAAATLLAHRASGLSAAARRQQINTSLEHLAIVGGFLLLIVYGAGPVSIDGLLR
jgi:putative oxidoreductase